MASLISSSGGPHPTERQLKHTLRNTKYGHYSVAAKHIIAVVDSYSDLKPSIKEFDYPAGKKADLMQLNGTIPVKMIEHQYNIPIRVWLPRGYPKEKPLVYINPTPNMAIAPVDYIDQQCCVDIPYLQEWRENKSDLLTLIQVLSFKFSQESPLYTVSSHHSSLPRMISGPKPERRSYITVTHNQSINTRWSNPAVQSVISCGHEQEMIQMRLDMEAQRKEIDSLRESLQTTCAQVVDYEDTVAKLEYQLNRQRVSVRNSFSSGVLDAMQKEMTHEIESEKKEKELYRKRLDAMVSEITQVREDIAILGVEKEEYQQRLKVTKLQLQHSLKTISELQKVNSDLEKKLKTCKHGQPVVQINQLISEDAEAEKRSEQLMDRLQKAEEQATIATKKVEEIETEKQELIDALLAQVNQTTEVEKRFNTEKEELLQKLNTSTTQAKEYDYQQVLREKQELENKLVETLRGLKKPGKVEDVLVDGSHDLSVLSHAQLVTENNKFKTMLDEALRNIKNFEQSKSRLQKELNLTLMKVSQLEEEARKLTQMELMPDENAALQKQLCELKKEFECKETQTEQGVVETQINDRDTISYNEIQLSQTTLGTGAWGYVVKGKFRGKSVAVKCLHKEILSCFSKAQVEREISIMAELRHPNLVLFMAAVLDAPSGPIIITELLSCTLRYAYQEDLIQHSGKLDIMSDIALALNYLHQHYRPIIHRDISSSNILLEQLANNKWRAKLSDFGSANLVHQATTPGEGALVYSAPEMKTGDHKQQSPSVDVYSYGVLLMEVITGTFPGDQVCFSGLLDQTTSKWPHISKVVAKCLINEPSNRPAMLDIISELETMETAEQ